ncbi:microsomal glutathione S-transferase 2-like [Babylonia areolata]|uniref:microsomal glutathione S-transferase 2-like n=1 Tax=Babylonia areolata TaxID=304850 RepID=UPI003FD67A80
MAPMFSMFATGPVTASRVVLTGIVTLGAGIQLVVFARRVYHARKQYEIEFPAVSGNRDFERIYRAQQTVLEWHPVFITFLWSSTLFFHQVPSAICGLFYIISRRRFFNGCSNSVEERMPGFYMGIRLLGIMGVMAAVGLGRTLVRMMVSHASQSGFEGPPFPWRGVQ